MKTFFKYLEKMPKTVITVIGVLMVMLLGAIDYLLGYEISFSEFYLLPVAFVSWFAKRIYAVIISIPGAATWLWADIASGHTYSYFAIPVWNSIMRLGFFLISAFSL